MTLLPYPRTARVCRRLCRVPSLWSRNWRSRRALGRLEPHRLDDIGLTAAQARREARRPFWRC